ncbi:MAG: VRR-NUC domain-containing protein [Pseudomonadales bacterium]|nr:VRR-NUC domain-containing protein [Pseudomonadales bacterium]MDP7359534.1 VRR-NUC domain-containing protein [Pseudomonadales bacterium]MDP7594953.1 VRR-NUC domain-containing protein [Pseudomonadales bacterium]HJN51257.1 VRR-NUC domain-containing protein [Pseudomonadales bacterium]
MPVPVDLPVGYYRDNFLALLDFVREQYADILTAEETAYADRFIDLTLDAQRLYVRLVSRRGPLFRSDKLHYAEILDLPSAARELLAGNFVDHGKDEDDSVILALLTKADLVALIGDKTTAIGTLPRSDLLDRVNTAAVDIRPQLHFEIYRPLMMEYLRLYRLLFFGNLSQDLTQFVLTDLGLLNYEKYVISADARLFKLREVVDKTLLLHELNESSHAAVEQNDREALLEIVALLPDSEQETTLIRRKNRILNRIGRQLERQQDYPNALLVYAQSSAPPARERSARILRKLALLPQSYALCQSIQGDPADEAELEFATRFMPGLQKKIGLEVSEGLSPVLLDDNNSLLVSLPHDEAVRVEESVRTYYDNHASRCYYVENHLFLGLFGLAFWDIIFMSVKGAFFNRYQSSPTDLYTPAFQSARQTAITDRLAEMKNSDRWLDVLHETYAEKLGVANRFVHWQVLSEEILQLSLQRIPASHLAHVFERLLWDLRNNRSGFPDLVLFPDCGSYQLLEVKGPGDRLQDNQKRWIRAFERFGIPYRVVNVAWS